MNLRHFYHLSLGTSIFSGEVDVDQSIIGTAEQCGLAEGVMGRVREGVGVVVVVGWGGVGGGFCGETNDH